MISTFDFIKAAKYGNTKTLLEYIEQKGDIEYQYGGYTALLWSARFGKLECVKELINAGANIDFSTFADQTACILATNHGHIDVLKLLIQAGVKHHTALIHAACHNQAACLTVLLQAGSGHSIYMMNNIPRNRRDVALHVSVFYNCISCVDVLLRAGACVNDRDIHGRNVLAVATGECLEHLQTIVAKQSERWYPELTEYYPDKFKETIETLLIWYIKDCPLPLELVFEICVELAKSMNNL